MNLDIKTTVQTAFVIAVLGAILSAIFSYRSFRGGTNLTYFRKRREMIMRGWRLGFTTIIFGVLAAFLSSYAEPVVYLIFKPSPTITNTPTITITPSITIPPTITLTFTITPTSSIPPTPEIPADIVQKFTSKVTPNPESVFSTLQFARKIDEDKQPVDPLAEFANPVTQLFGTFSYDKILPASQWTALWVRLENQEVICYETKPWDGSTGGWGATTCNPSTDKWMPGKYEVQIFIGNVFLVRSGFIVTGKPIKPTITITPSRTKTPTFTITPSRTITPTPVPSSTKTASTVPSLTPTRTPTASYTSSITPVPSRTSRPMRTQALVTATE